MNGLIRALALGMLRNLAVASGTAMVAHGYLTASQTDGWVGSLVFLGGVVFTVVDKLRVEAKIGQAHATAPDAPLPFK